MINETCLHRVLGDCRECEENTNPYRHPNNLDCPRYVPVTVRTFEVGVGQGIDRFYDRYPGYSRQRIDNLGIGAMMIVPR